MVMTGGLAQRVQANRGAFAIEAVEGVGFVFDQTEELGWRDVEAEGRFAEVPVGGGDDVHGLREHGWVVVVIGVEGDLAAADAGAPEGGADLAERDRGAEVDRKREAQAPEGNSLVLGLAAALAGVGLDAGGGVGDLDFGLDLVAVLATGAGSAAALDRALLEQFLIRQARGVMPGFGRGSGRGAGVGHGSVWTGRFRRRLLALRSW